MVNVTIVEDPQYNETQDNYTVFDPNSTNTSNPNSTTIVVVLPYIPGPEPLPATFSNTGSTFSGGRFSRNQS